MPQLEAFQPRVAKKPAVSDTGNQVMEDTVGGWAWYQMRPFNSETVGTRLSHTLQTHTQDIHWAGGGSCRWSLRDQERGSGVLL